MGYIDQNLMPDERVIVHGKLHWLILVWPMVMTAGVGLVVLVCAGLVLSDLDDLVRLLAMIAGAFFALMFVGGLVAIVDSFLSYFFGEELAVTDRRLIAKSGVFKRRHWELPFRQIESVSYDQSLLERFFSAGQLKVRGTGRGWVQTALLANFREFRQAVTSRVEAVHQPELGHGGEIVTRGFSEA